MYLNHLSSVEFSTDENKLISGSSINKMIPQEERGAFSSLPFNLL